MSYKEKSSEPAWTGTDFVWDIYLHEDKAQSGSSPYSSATTVELKVQEPGGAVTNYTASAVSASDGHYRVTGDSSFHDSPGRVTVLLLVDGVIYDHARVVRFAEKPT